MPRATLERAPSLLPGSSGSRGGDQAGEEAPGTDPTAGARGTQNPERTSHRIWRFGDVRYRWKEKPARPKKTHKSTTMTESAAYLGISSSCGQTDAKEGEGQKARPDSRQEPVCGRLRFEKVCILFWRHQEPVKESRELRESVLYLKKTGSSSGGGGGMENELERNSRGRQRGQRTGWYDGWGQKW